MRFGADMTVIGSGSAGGFAAEEMPITVSDPDYPR
jgi:choline dehydrogenase-like flavoprotein